MGVNEIIFMTANEVMDRWGIIDPYDFIGLISLEPAAKGSLRACERGTKEPAVFDGPEDREGLYFVDFVDYEGRLGPDCLEYLSFKFGDVMEYEAKNPDILSFAGWARGYRQKTGQNARQGIDEAIRKIGETSAQGLAEFAKIVTCSGDKVELEEDEITKRSGMGKICDERSSTVTEDNDEDLIMETDQPFDNSNRKGPRKVEIARARVRAIAEVLLEESPELRIAQLVKSRYIRDIACNIDVKSKNGNESVKELLSLKENTLRDCVKDLCKPGSKGSLPGCKRNQEIKITVSFIDK